MLAVLGMLAVLTGHVRAQANTEPVGRIEGIQLKTEAAATKVIIMLSRPLPFDVRVLGGESSRKSARRLVLDFANATLAPAAAAPIEVKDGFVRQIRPGQFTATTARIVLDLASNTKHSVEAYETPPHVTVVITEAPGTASPSPDKTTEPL